MSGSYFSLFDMAIAGVPVLAFCIWQLISINREIANGRHDILLELAADFDRHEPHVRAGNPGTALAITLLDAFHMVKQVLTVMGRCKCVHTVCQVNQVGLQGLLFCQQIRPHLLQLVPAGVVIPHRQRQCRQRLEFTQQLIPQFGMAL